MKRCLRFLLFVGITLTGQPGYSATCPTPTFDPATANVHASCLIIGEHRWNVELKYSAPPSLFDSEGMYWKLSSMTPSTCDWSPTTCATTNSNLDLTLPLTGVANSTNIAKLRLIATSEG